MRPEKTVGFGPWSDSVERDLGGVLTWKPDCKTEEQMGREDPGCGREKAVVSRWPGLREVVCPV